MDTRPDFKHFCTPLRIGLLCPLFVGCASDIRVSEPGISHPAHVQAESAPAYPPSSILLNPDPVTRTPPASPQSSYGSASRPTHDPSHAVTTPTAHDQHAPGATEPASQPAADVDRYVCPMHPDVTSPQPGQCPKCGMTMVEKVERPE